MAFDPLAPSSKSVFDPLAPNKTTPVYDASKDPTIGRATKQDLVGLQKKATITAPPPEKPFLEKTKDSILKFGAETAVTFLDLGTKATSALVDLVARNPGLITKMVSPSLDPLMKAAPQQVKDKGLETWKNVINSTSGALADNALGEVAKLKEAPFIQPSFEYQNATLKEKLTTQLPETVLHLGANAVGSLAWYVLGGGVGAGVQALAIAHDIKGYAREAGMDETQSDALAVSTGIAVGLVDKMGFEKVFGSKSLSETFVKGFFSRIAKKSFIEGSTEVLQEDIQLAAEATIREDLGGDEVMERNVMSFLGGTLGGGMGSVISDVFNNVKTQATKQGVPEAEPTIKPPTIKTEPPISRIVLEKKPGESQSLMDRMKSKERFQLGIDTKTAESLNIGDPANPSIGSVFEVNSELFIVRDVDQTKGDVVGYKLPLDGSPTVSLETVNLASLKPVQTDIGTITSAIQNSQVPTGISRSTQFVTEEKSIETLKKYFNDEDLTVSFIDKINTPDGSVAFGRYTPGMIELVRNPHKTTADHEAVHAYLDLFYEQDEKQNVYQVAREQMGKEGMADADVEEWVADRFAAFVQGRQGVTGAIKDFFDRVVSFLRRVFRRTNPDAVAKLFDDIRMKNRPVGGKILNSVQKEYYQKPEELTAKIFTLPEVSDRVTIGRTHLSDLMKSSKANLKQAEFLLLQDVLNTQFKSDNDPLIEEAKKYRSAEEFINAQGEPIFHGTTRIFDEFDLSKVNKFRTNEFGGPVAIYFSPTKEVASKYTKSAQQSLLDKDRTIKILKQRDKLFGEIVELLVEKGSDAVSPEMWKQAAEAGKQNKIDYNYASDIAEAIEGSKVAPEKQGLPGFGGFDPSVNRANTIHTSLKRELGLDIGLIKQPREIETFLDPSAKIKDLGYFNEYHKKTEDDHITITSAEQLRAAVEQAEKEGYDGIKFETEYSIDNTPEIAIWNSQKIKTKLQLETIWNQSQKPSNDKIDVQAFKDAVHAQLLPLDTKVSSQGGGEGRYENVVLPDDVRGDVEEYYENIYQSPIETSAGNIHFGGSDTDGEVSRYFAHTRLEDMDDGETRRVIELQSDLFQRGRLESEKRKVVPETLDYTTGEKVVTPYHVEDRSEVVKKLEVYSQSWWQRIVREEIRKAAVDGKNVLLFPTGETAMKVEGLGAVETNQRWGNRTQRLALTPDNFEKGLRVGDEVGRIPSIDDFTPDVMNSYIITEVTGEGKFKAVPKNDNLFDKKVAGTEELAPGIWGDSRNVESFDISGKIDRQNPIYKFYESDVGMYLNRLRKGNIEAYTDPQGVTWLKTAVTQEDLAPVIAYQKAEQIPEEDYRAYLESGAIPTPDSTLMAEESVATYEIERELGYIPKPGEMPAGLAAQLDERRNDALVRMQELELQEQVEKEQAALLLEEGLVFMDSDMENSYEKFKKNAKRNSWMLESSTDVGTLKTKLPKINVNTEYFPSVEGMSDDEMLEAYQSRYEIETELIEKIGKKTAIEIRSEAKRLAQKVVKDASIKKSERIKTTIKRINTRPKTTITMDESRLLQNRIRAMSEGAKSGAKFMKDEMIQKWRQSESDRLEIVNQLADYMSENLPPQQRGRFVRAIGKIKDLKNALELMDQIDRVQAGVEKREAVSELKEQIVKFKKGGANIALDYANRVRDILSSFDATKPTEATMRRINAMAQYLDQNPDAFVTKEMISKLKRLTKTPLADMSVSEIKEVVDSVKELARLGKLKQDLKNMYDERVWEKNVIELIESTVNRDPSEGTMKKANDAIIAASDEISAPARVFDAMDGDVNYQGPNVKLYRTIRNATQQAEIVGNEIAMDFLEGIKKAGFDSLTEEQQRVIYLHAVLEQGNDGSVGETMTKHEMENLRDLTENEQKILVLAREILGRQTDDFATVYEEKRNKPFVRVENYIPFRYADANPMSAEDYVMDERMFKSSVEPGSTIQRAPSVKRELRTDFINIILQAIESQSNYIYVEPVMMNAASLVKSKEYREASGMHNSHYWNEYIDMVARNGASANALKMRFMDSFIKGARFNVTAGILGGRLTTIILQPFNLFHSYGILSQKYGVKTANLLFKEVGKTFLNGSYAKGITAQSPALTLREGGDATVREMKEIVGASSTDNKYLQARNKLIEWSLKFMQEADLRTASATNETFYKILRAQGMSEEQARSESDFATDLITSSSQIADRPMIFSRGEAARTFSMFMSFALNEWGIISHDVVKTGLIKGDYKAKYRAGFALSAIFASKMLEQVARNALSNLFKKEDDDKELPSAFAMSAISVVSAFPFLGPAVASMIKGFDPEIVGNPILSTAEDAIRGGDAAITGQTEAARMKGALRFAKSISTLTGVPVFPLLLDWIKNTIVE